MSGCFNMLVFSVTCWKQLSLSVIYLKMLDICSMDGYLSNIYIYICSLDGLFDVKFRYFFNWSLSMYWYVIFFFFVNEYLPSWTSLLLKGNCGFYILWSLLVLPCYNQSNILSKTEVVSISMGERMKRSITMLPFFQCWWRYFALGLTEVL